MPTWSVKPFEYLYLHEDGNFYTHLKCPYAGESELCLVYPNGFFIPARMVANGPA